LKDKETKRLETKRLERVLAMKECFVFRRDERGISVE
jgi:hypothetical protein